MWMLRLTSLLFSRLFPAGIHLLLFIGTGFLLSSEKEKRAQADRITYLSVTVGYFLFTVGVLIFGMVWAEQAWGSYWSWDPKETWALITWLTYTLYLHLRFMRKARGKLTAWVAVIGFGFTMFTFFGENYLMDGLHSYV